MRTCPRCGQDNPEEARFCLHCGEPLVEPEQRRVERKVAAVLFADLVGSTSLAEVVQTVGSILNAWGAGLYLPEVEALNAAG
jgi:class 3 adenylate cyclase